MILGEKTQISIVEKFDSRDIISNEVNETIKIGERLGFQLTWAESD